MLRVAQSEISLPIGITTHEVRAIMTLNGTLTCPRASVQINIYAFILHIWNSFLSHSCSKKNNKKTPNVDVVDHNETELCLDKSNIGHQIESLICWSMIEAYPLEAFLAYQSYII